MQKKTQMVQQTDLKTNKRRRNFILLQSRHKNPRLVHVYEGLGPPFEGGGRRFNCMPINSFPVVYDYCPCYLDVCPSVCKSISWTSAFSEEAALYLALCRNELLDLVAPIIQSLRASLLSVVPVILLDSHLSTITFIKIIKTAGLTFLFCKRRRGLGEEGRELGW